MSELENEGRTRRQAGERWNYLLWSRWQSGDGGGGLIKSLWRLHVVCFAVWSCTREKLKWKVPGDIYPSRFEVVYLVMSILNHFILLHNFIITSKNVTNVLKLEKKYSFFSPFPSQSIKCFLSQTGVLTTHSYHILDDTNINCYIVRHSGAVGSGFQSSISWGPFCVDSGQAPPPQP